jgi:RHS repeat-associated protein
MGNKDAFNNNDGVFGNSLIDDATLVKPLTDSPSPLNITQSKDKNSGNYDPFASINDDIKLKNSKTDQTPVVKPLEQPSIFTQPNLLPVTQPITPTNKNTDTLTGNKQNTPLLSAASTDPLTGSTKSALLAASSITPPIPNFAIRTESTVRFNGGGDLDGNPLDLNDDALIYAAKGFTINGNITLPVQRNASGNPILDASGKPILINNAVAVSSGYTVANGPSNQYAGLIPPPVIPLQTINVPAYADLKQQELNHRIAVGTPTVTFNISQNPIKNANDWNAKFPSPGTASNPTLVRVIGGGLEIPNGVTINNYVITVDSGDITFKGNNHTLNNVMLVANNGSIDMARAQTLDIAAFASNSITMAGNARFEGNTTIANGSNSGSITFNGASKNLNSSSKMQVVSQGSITWSGASDTRGTFISAGDFTFNGNSTLYGSINAKGNITFNGQATVTYAADTAPDFIAPVITASLEQDTGANGTTNTDKITFDPTIVGAVTDTSSIAEFKAGFDSTPTANFVNVLTQKNADGSFRLTRSQLEQINGGTLADGTHTLKLQAKDSSGNTTSVYEFIFTLDTTEVAPNNLDLTAATDSGKSDTDNITNNTTPSITGNANAGALVQLSNSGQVIASSTADSTGKWQITSTTLTNGTYNLTATATDIAGNVSAASQPLSINIDTVAPISPTLKLTAATDTGASNSDGITKNNTPIIAGTAEANSTVKLYKDGQLVGTTNASVNGEWQVQLGTLANGNYIFTATSTDTAGNISAPSSQYTVTVDTQINPPSNLDLITPSDSGISNVDNITKVTTPIITGNADANTTVQLFNAGQIVGQATTGSDGKWQITTNNLANGTYNLNAQATDIAGNVSTSSPPLQVIIDSALPQITLTTPINTQPLQQNAKLTGNVDGTGSSVIALQYRFDENAEIALPFSFTGVFDSNIDFTGISNGSHTLSIIATDTAGNIKTTQYNVTVALDNQAPVITASLQRDTATGGVTNQDKITFDPTITGTVIDASDVVEFKAGLNNAQVANFVDVLPYRNSNGSFTFDRTLLNTISGGGNVLPDGQHTLKLVAEDKYGNVSVNYEFTFTLDTTTPTPILNLVETSDTGISQSDRITNDNTPTITGNGEVGAIIQLFNDTQVVGQTTVDTSGIWQITTSELTDGVKSLSAIASDIAGNTITSTSIGITVDTLLPQLILTTPLESSPLQLGAKLTGNINSTGSPLTAFSYRFNSGTEIPVNFNAAGTFDQNLDFTGLGNGNHTLTITATDTAGNILTSQYNVIVNLDIAAPVIMAALVRDTAANVTTNLDKITFDPSIVGSVVDASQVAEFKAGFDNTPVANFINVLPQRNADGTFSLTRTQLETIYGGTLPDGIRTLRLIAKDAEGNQSDIYSFSFTLDTNVAQPTFNLDATSDSDIIGDRKTKFNTVTLTGLTEPGATLILEQTGANGATSPVLGQNGTPLTVTADNTGKYSFTNVELTGGNNTFTVLATDIAGNTSSFSTIIYCFSTPTAINLTYNTVAENSDVGTVIGELSSIDPDIGDAHTYTLIDTAGGRFKIVDNKLQVANGTLLDFETNTQYKIIVQSTDANGLSKTQELTIGVTNVNEAPSFSSTPINTVDGRTYTYNIITTDPDVSDTRNISAINLPSWLTLINNGNGTAALTGNSTNILSDSNINLTVTDASGLTATQGFTITPNNRLVEGSNFNTTQNFNISIPTTPSILSFKIDTNFDSSDTKSINDAFEVALVDANGNSLVHTIKSLRDAFFNLTEGENAVTGAGVTYDSTTQTVKLNLTGASSGLATLIFRLVNNDSDRTTSVSIADFAITRAPLGTVAPTQTTFTPSLQPSTAPNFNLLTDVSNSFTPLYHRTSFNEDTKTLYADIAIRNNGSYSVDAPLLVAVQNITDPSVVLLNLDGVTPDGIPYYNFTNLVVGDKLNPNQSTGERSLVFYNKNGVQFKYDLVVLAQLNQKPAIDTKPVIEIIGGQQYRYDVNATDPNEDILTYKLLTSPDGMSIDSRTGLISWDTQASNKGNHAVAVEVNDGRGEVMLQDYTLSVIDAPFNRPPIFVTTPKVDAKINTQYTYTARATDADNDSLTYSLVDAPTGMTINIGTGQIDWKPTVAAIDNVPVTVRVADGRGGVADQSFKINIQPEPGNHAPIIISDPITKVYNPTSQYDGVVFGLKSQAPGGTVLSIPPTKLFSFDLNGSNFQDLGAVTINGELIDADGLALSEKYGLLGFALSGNNSTLISINPNTAVATVLGIPLVGRHIRGAVFDLDDNLWVIDAASTALLMLNPNNGSVLKSVSLTSSGQPFIMYDEGTDIAIDGEGKFYLTAYSGEVNGSIIYTLNASTGALTEVALDPWQYLEGITFASADNNNRLFSYEANYSDDIYSYDINANYQRTVIFPDIISQFNSGGGDLAAIVRKPRYSYSVKAVDPDNDSLTYKLVNTPYGMEIDSITGKVTWANPVVSAMPYDVAVQVIDGRGGVDTQSFKLDVSDVATSQIAGKVYVDDGQPLNRLVYFNDFEDPSRSNNEWSNPLRDVTPIGNRHFLGRYGGSFYNESLRQTRLTLDNLSNHETVTVSFKLYVNDSWNGSLGYFAPDTWKLNVVGGSTLLYTTFGSGYPNGLPQAYPNNYNPNNPNANLNPSGTGAVETNTLGYYLKDPWGDAVYNLSFTFEHDSSSLALDFIGGTDESINNESWGLDDVEISVGRKPEGLTNWSVYLDNNNNNQRDLNEISTLTDDKGNYSFIVAPGNHIVATELQTGWTQVQPANSNYQVTVNNNQAITNLNFGNRSGVTGQVAPTFLNMPPLKAMVGQKYSYRAAATDLNGDILSYDLVVKPDGMVADSKTGLVNWQPTAGQVGTQNVVLRVRDHLGYVDLQAFEIKVAPFNSAPQFTNDFRFSSYGDIKAQVNVPVEYKFNAVDADGDPITYSLKQAQIGSNVSIDPETGVLTWIPTMTGNQPFIITASDGKGGITDSPFDIQVVASGANDKPTITSNPRTKLALGQTYLYVVQASDPNNDALTYTLDLAPIGMTVNKQGVVSWTPGSNQLGKNSVTIQVSDGRGGIVKQSFDINVVSTTTTTNSAPSITSAPNLITNVGREYQYNLIGTDPDNDLLLWSFDAAPTGMVIDATTGALRFSARTDQIGEHTVAIRLLDAYGVYNVQEFTLTVNGVNIAPTIISTPITRAAQNQQYTYEVVATDPENDAITYSLDSVSRNKGITIDNNGIIKWTPGANQIGSHAVTATVSDNLGASNTQIYTIEVGTTAINNAPTITSTPKFVASVGSPYQYQVVATDPDTFDTLTYQILSKPSGVDIQINPTTGLLTWASPTSGQYQIVVGAVDSAGLGAAQRFTLTARSNNAPLINSTAVTSATPGAAYSYDVKAVDADGDRLIYTLDQLSSDKGITVDALGRLRWNPTTTNVGNNPINVTVNDGNGGIATQTINLNVTGDTEAPKVRLIALNNTANLGDDITFQARATDNVKVASLQLTVDGTPVVLDANGIVTVKASRSGTIRAIAEATDTSGNTKQETFDVLVIDPTDVTAPTVSFQLEGINDGEFVKALTSIRATITDDGQLDYYRLLVAPVDGGEFKELWRNDNPNTINNGLLVEKFDPSLLQNDSYVVRLEVADNGGKISYSEQTVDVAGELKLGNFRLSFTDLTVPVTGIPISLTRTYDTLTSNTRDDFGYGWRMEFRDTDLRTSVGKPSEEEQLLGIQKAFKDGTKVYITLPGGKREAFTFKPKMVEQVDGDSLLYFAKYFYKPEFVADKGSTSTLTVENGFISKRLDGNEYFGFQGNAYNPADSLFGGKYTLTTKEGIKYEIDALTGDLLTVTDNNGNKLTYTDDAITSSTGQKVTFERDAEGRITSVKDPLGELVRYEYDASGDLVSVSDRENNTTRMEYNQEREHYLDKIIDPLGRTGVRNEYGDDGRLKELVDVNGQKVEMTYDPNNSRQTVLDQLGHATTYEYDARGNILTEIDAEGQMIKRKYDDNNYVLEETVISDRSGLNGFTTKYTYDSQGNQLTQEDALGNITRYTYGDKSRLLTETDALGRTTTNTYSKSGNLRSSTDALGHTTSYDYDLRGELRSVKDANGKVTAFDYDDNGNVTSVTDALSNVTTYTYNANGDKLTETRQMTLTNGQVRELLTTWTYDDNGRMKTMTDAENHTTTYEYDKLGHQTAVIDALQQRTEYKYDDKGQLVGTIYADNTPDNPNDNPREISRYDEAGRIISTIDKAGRETRFVYDKVGRLRYTVLPDSTPDNPNISPELWDNPKTETVYYDDGLVKAQIDERGNRTEVRYDADGRQTEIIYADNTPNTLDDNPRTTYKYDQVGQQLSQTDALNHTTTYKYDDLGRLTKTEFNDKTYTTSEYDNLGRRIAMTDQNSKRTEYRYDALGRLTGVKNALQDWTEYGYNEVGNLIWIEDANDHRTSYEYDRVGRRTATILPLDQRSDTVYDAVGNLKTYTDFNRNITTYNYDSMNWMTSKQFQDGSKVSYAYTQVGLQDIVTFIDVSGQTTATYDYDYDVRDRLTKRTDPDGRKIEYTYDVASNRTSVTTASGTVNYTFDVRNRLDQVIENSVVTADSDYDAVSNLVRTTFANGTQEIRSYDELNRLKYLENHKGDTILSSYSYTLDKVGNRTKVVERDGRTVDYTYDDLYRLMEEKITDAVNGNRLYGYTYDKVGNRKTKSEAVNGATTVTDYVYDANDRLLDETVNQQIVANYTYDHNGNTLTKTENGITTEYTWDYENRLIAAIVKDANGAIQQAMQYRYNDRGIRVAATVNGVETRYLVDEVQPYAQVLEEYSPNGMVLVEYVYGNDLIAQEKASDRTFYHVDGLGSTRILTDAQGSVVTTYNYDAFGKLLNSTGGVENKYLFAGEQYDQNLGDYYLRQRYYDTNSGRFTRRDTYEGRLSEPMTLHKYFYGNLNPVNFIDPSGLSFTASEQALAFSIETRLAVTAYVIVTKSYHPEQLRGFGEDERPRTILDGLLTWRNTWAPETLGGFSKDSQPTVSNHTGHSSRGINDLVRYIFAISDPFELANDIAYGHAWNPARNLEWAQLGINNQQQLADRIYDIMIFYEQKKVDGDKTIYLGPDGTIVVDNPRDPDGGTAFNPNIQQENSTASREYFDRQPGRLED